MALAGQIIILHNHLDHFGVRHSLVKGVTAKHLWIIHTFVLDDRTIGVGWEVFKKLQEYTMNAAGENCTDFDFGL